MYIIKNSIKNIVKNMGRYVLFGILILILLITGLISLKTYYSSDNTINRLKQTLSSTYTIAQAGKTIGGISALETKFDELTQIAEFEEVDYYNIKQVAYLFKTPIPNQDYNDYLPGYIPDPIDDSENIESEYKCVINGKNIDLIEYDNKPGSWNFIPGSIYIIGYNENYKNVFYDSSDENLFYKGGMYKNEKECVILKSLYDINAYNGNSIDIGDELEFQTAIESGEGKNEPYTIKYKIVGIVYDDAVLDSNFLRIEKKIVHHGITFIYTTMDGASLFDSTPVSPYIAVFEDRTSYRFEGPEFQITLKSPDLSGEFLEKVYDFKKTDEGDSKYAVAKVYNYTDEIIEPLERTQRYNNIFIIVTGMVFFAVVTIMTFVIMNERKYDIGVLRSVGMSKTKLILGLILEIFIFMLAVCAIGLFTGYFISENITFFNINAAEYGVYTDFANTFAPSMIAVFGFTILLSITASFLSLIYIIKYNPMKILRNRT